MADILIYWKDHWMDSLTPTQIQKYVNKDPNFMTKYNARNQRGDIVSVFPDGRIHSKAHANTFAILRVPGVTVQKAKAFIGSLKMFDGLDRDGIPRMRVTKKSKYQLNVSALPVAAINAINTARVVTINKNNLLNNLIEKTF